MLERYGHGGDVRTAAELFGHPPDTFLDFSANMNPLGPPDSVRSAIAAYAEDISCYPDPAVRELTNKLAARYAVPAESILIGNGAAELIDLLVRGLRPGTVAIARPSFSEYEEAVRKSGGRTVDIPLSAERQFTVRPDDVEAVEGRVEAFFLGHPNNPTGRLLPEPTIQRLRASGRTIILDEAFIDFVAGEEGERVSLLREAAADQKLFVIRSMTKFYAIPGIRLGFLVGHPDRIAALKALQVTWSVNSLAERIGLAVLDDAAFAAATAAWLGEARRELTEQLEHLGLQVTPSVANFLLLRLPDSIDVREVQRSMGKKGVLLRDASLFPGLDRSYARVAVRSRSDNERLVRALGETLTEFTFKPVNRSLSQDVAPGSQPGIPIGPCTDPATPKSQQQTPAPIGLTLMLQGTASDVGKSLLTAALCRIFTDDGLQVAPFKSQNMSLNSYITPDGKEIGRAQGMQADACRIAATTDMNPILLKPTREMAAQVVVHGKPLADMDARQYRERYLPTAAAIVRDALARLRAAHELVVIEGAGSPAEINLKDRDIVNMRLAGWADAPVLLVADIDRGGVFASIVGTLELLEQAERDRIQGIIINKFRGDVSLLQPGLTWLEQKIGKPVLGVIPFLPDVGLEDEDSASLAERLRSERPSRRADQLDIAVVKLPYLSNFTDFDPLLVEPDVSLRYVDHASSFGEPDAVLLPGSKNTIGDLQALYHCGLAECILRYVETGGFLVGICAGFQMLGRRLSDPYGVESETAQLEGLGLFPTETIFAREKRTERVVGVASDWYGLAEVPVSGYELHMGQTVADSRSTVHHPFRIREERDAARPLVPEGAANEDGRVWGTYVHGILHNDELRRAWLNRIRQHRGWPLLASTLQFGARREAAFDRLAAHVRGHLDLDRIYEMIGLTKRTGG